jgi:hypothetical protein
MTDKEQEVLEIARKFMEEHSEAMQQLAEIERKEFYRFFAIDYFATGEGRSYWLKICRNYQSIDDRDREKEKFKEFVGVGADYYMHGFEELTEEEFMQKYAELIPHHVKVQVNRRDQPFFTWETHLHVNYS